MSDRIHPEKKTPFKQAGDLAKSPAPLPGVPKLTTPSRTVNAPPSGVIAIDKPQQFTSHDVVNIVRRLYGTRKVGHAGTLDPLATGVLVVLIGRGAKASEYITSDSKSYRAEFKLGLTSDTGDITGNLTHTGIPLPQAKDVLKAASEFKGDIKQTPPMYSALKVGGRKLVDLARQGIEIERAARDITIHEIKAAPLDENAGLYSLELKCSKGTYVRTVCTDIGEVLGCGAVMTALRRTQSGLFTESECHTLEQIENMSADERGAALYPVESLFRDCPAVVLPPFFAKLARDGAEVYLHKIGTTLEVGERVRLYDTAEQTGGKSVFFALSEVREYPGGAALKPIKQFDID